MYHYLIGATEHNPRRHRRSGFFYCLKTPDVSRATPLKALLGNLRFIVTWKTWTVLVVFGAGVAASVALCHTAGGA